MIFRECPECGCRDIREDTFTIPSRHTCFKCGCCMEDYEAKMIKNLVGDMIDAAVKKAFGGHDG